MSVACPELVKGSVVYLVYSEIIEESSSKGQLSVVSGQW